MAPVKNKENAGMLKVKGVVKKPVSKAYSFGSDMKKIAEDDPRKIVHSIKVGLTIALVSLFYYFEPFFHYEGFGVSAMWAVLTVVVVFEFSVGKFPIKSHVNFTYNHRTKIIKLFFQSSMVIN